MNASLHPKVRRREGATRPRLDYGCSTPSLGAEHIRGGLGSPEPRAPSPWAGSGRGARSRPRWPVLCIHTGCGRSRRRPLFMEPCRHTQGKPLEQGQGSAGKDSHGIMGKGAKRFGVKPRVEVVGAPYGKVTGCVGLWEPLFASLSLNSPPHLWDSKALQRREGVRGSGAPRASPDNSEGGLPAHDC